MDKVLHLITCLFMAGIITALRGPLPALALTLLIGLAKELYDEARYQGFDWRDIAADILGMVAGIMIGLAIRAI